MCHTPVCRAKQFGTTPGEINVHGIYSTVAGDFCVNEVLQIYLVILIGLTNVSLELSLFYTASCTNYSLDYRDLPGESVHLCVIGKEIKPLLEMKL